MVLKVVIKRTVFPAEKSSIAGYQHKVFFSYWIFQKAFEKCNSQKPGRTEKMC